MRIFIILSGTFLTCVIYTTAFAQDKASTIGELTERCQYPKQLSIPNGKKATEAELLATQEKMKAYLAEGDTFIECLKRVETEWSEEETKEKKLFIIVLHNRIIDNMNEVAELFNSAVRAFKGKK